MAIHKIILAISTISIPIILAIINTPTSLQKITYGGIDYTQSINLHMITEQNMNIEDEGRGSREGSPDAS